MHRLDFTTLITAEKMIKSWKNIRLPDYLKAPYMYRFLQTECSVSTFFCSIHICSKSYFSICFLHPSVIIPAVTIDICLHAHKTPV